MGLFTSKEFNNMDDLFWDEIGDLYDAEHRIVDALPSMAQEAHDPALREAFQMHLEETRNHVERLERIFEHHDRRAKRVTCDGIRGILTEGNEVVGATGSPEVKDAALIAAAQRVEHYEMAGYGSARNFARCLGDSFAAELLQETLNEEGDADHKLTSIADQHVNIEAAQHV